uniref:G-protein coupled receptors family 1 profile domain-containing protein n=1 Tax=Pseudonaja textilis TaxID=8673 RepID=A0A670XM06_PSETE
MAVHSQLLNGSCLISSDLFFTGLDLLCGLKPPFIPLYALLVSVACPRNPLLLLLLCLISFTEKLHSTTNLLIGNLAAADLIMCVFCVPLTAVYAFESQGWLFGAFMCSFVTLIQGTTMFMSVLSLTAIAVDRYIVIVHPICQRVRCKCYIYIVAATCLNSIGHDMIVCEEIWLPWKTERQLYSCLMSLLSYMPPLAAMLFSSCAISYHLQKRKISGATFQILVISVLCFGLRWLPLQLVNLIRDMDEEFADPNKRYVNVIQVSGHVAAMSSACFNPFIYASLHEKLRLRIGSYFYQRKKSSLVSHKTSQLNTCFTLAARKRRVLSSILIQTEYSDTLHTC